MPIEEEEENKNNFETQFSSIVIPPSLHSDGELHEIIKLQELPLFKQKDKSGDIKNKIKYWVEKFSDNKQKTFHNKM